MMVSRPMSGCKQRMTEQFADSANLFAVQPVRPDFEGCLELNRESGRNQNRTGLGGEQNPYPLRM